MNTGFRVWLASPMLAIALVGCASTGGGLASSAERLERTSSAFERSADEGYERDARQLAEEAREFRQALSDRRADDRDVREAFQDLSRRYHAARDEIERDRDRNADRDFAAVTEAYLDVERAMNATDNRRDRRDRVARDD
jgi:uncharacterized protein YukE